MKMPPDLLALVDALFASTTQFDIVICVDGGFYSITSETATTAEVCNSTGERIGTLTADAPGGKLASIEVISPTMQIIR